MGEVGSDLNKRAFILSGVRVGPGRLGFGPTRPRLRSVGRSTVCRLGP